MEAEEFSLETCANKLTRHGFEVEIVSDVAKAGERLRDEIRLFAPRTVSYGDSMTVRATGIIEELRERKALVFYDGFDKDLSREENLELCR